MKKKLLKALAISFIVLLLFAGGIKLHFLLTAPTVSDWNYHQLQKIDRSQGAFSFIVFGDNKDSGSTFGRLIADLNQSDARFAIDDGDLVEVGEQAQFKFFLSQIQTSQVPLLTVMGNHELDGGRKAYYDIFGPFYYAFSVGNAYFIVLDDANEEGLDDAQLAWLENELQKAQNYKYRFVFMHVPLYDPRKGAESKGHSLQNLAFAKKLNGIFDRYHVTMLFTSHIHGYFKGQWGKTPYIITGGAGAPLASEGKAHRFHHYIRVDVSDSGVQYTVVKVESSALAPITDGVRSAWITFYAFCADHFLEVVLGLTAVYYVLFSLVICLSGRGLLFVTRRMVHFE